MSDLIKRLRAILSLYTLGHKKAIEDAIAELERQDAVIARLGDEKSFTSERGVDEYYFDNKYRIQYAIDNRSKPND